MLHFIWNSSAIIFLAIYFPFFRHYFALNYGKKRIGLDFLPVVWQCMKCAAKWKLHFNELKMENMELQTFVLATRCASHRQKLIQFIWQIKMHLFSLSFSRYDLILHPNIWNISISAVVFAFFSLFFLSMQQFERCMNGARCIVHSFETKLTLKSLCCFYHGFF